MLHDSLNCFSENTLTGLSMILTGEGLSLLLFSGDSLDGVDCLSVIVMASVGFFTIFSSLISEALHKIKLETMFTGAP